MKKAFKITGTVVSYILRLLLIVAGGAMGFVLFTQARVARDVVLQGVFGWSSVIVFLSLWFLAILGPSLRKTLQGVDQARRGA